MKAFITGSHVYGTPREDSDVDLVVCADPETIDRLNELLNEFYDPDPDYGEDGFTCRLGKLNLIVAHEKSYETWKRSRDECIAIVEKALAPLDRARAVRIHNKNKRWYRRLWRWIVG